MSGQDLRIFFLSSLAQIMNAFIGRLMCCLSVSLRSRTTLGVVFGPSSSLRLSSGEEEREGEEKEGEEKEVEEKEEEAKGWVWPGGRKPRDW